jgi:hypothetical protein
MILELYYFLLKYTEIYKSSNKDNKEVISFSIYEDIRNLITNKMIKMEDTKRNKEYQRVYKLPFFYIIESLSKISRDKLTEILDSTENDKILKDIFNSVQYHIRNILNLNKKFLLFGKEVFFIDIIYKIIYNIKVNSNSKDDIFFSYDLKAFSEFLKTDNFNDNNKTDEDFNKNIINNIKNNNEKIFTIFQDNLDEYKYLENKILLNYYKMYAETRIRESIINDVLLQYKFQLIEYS